MKRNNWNKAFLCLLLAFSIALMAACSLPFGSGGEEEPEPEPEVDPEYPVTVAGADLGSRPGKVVTLTPDLTEKVLDLSMGDRLVGVSDYCQSLDGTDGLPACGSALLPDLEALAELQPHLVLTSVELPEAPLIALQQMGVEVAVFPSHVDTLDELLETYQGIAMLLEGQTTGSDLGSAFADRFRTRISDITRAAADQILARPASVLYLRELPFVIATGDTLEHTLMDSVGLYAIGKEHSGWLYPAGDAAGDAGRAAFQGVDVIFMDESAVTIKDLEQSEFYKSLDAVLQDRYFYIDAAAFERQGLSMINELEYMAAYCYPGAGLATRPEPAEAPEADSEEPDSGAPGDGADGSDGGGDGESASA